MFKSILRSRRTPAALIFAALAVGCSDGGTGPDAEPVAAVEIAGVPEQLFVGATVQLNAITRDAAGAQLANRAVAWLSSDTMVAQVSATGMVTGRASGDAVIVATSESKSATAMMRVRVEAVTSVRITGAPTAPVRAGASVQLQAQGLNVAGTPLPNRPVFWMSNNQLVATVTPAGLLRAVGPGQTRIAAVVSDVGAEFSLTVEDTVGSVRVVSPATALYQTQTTDMSATAVGGAGGTLTGRPVTWASSDQALATVDATGKVTAVGVGDVTITATVEGKSGSVSLKLLQRHTASWSGATEWTTFQGNARHTGHVAVTADPVVFRTLWSRSPLGSGNRLNPVTEGGGRVFVSNQAYFGAQQMAALNARTGTEVWSHSFGQIHSVHPPAYGNGRVYVTTGGHQDSYLYSFDAATGAFQFRASYGNQWSRWYAPVVVDGTVYMAGGYYGGMYAFGATEGEAKWFYDTGQFDEWGPAVADGRVYAFTNSGLKALDAATGATLFTIGDQAYSQFYTGLTPVLGSSSNIVATFGGQLLSFDLQNRRIGWQRAGNFRDNQVVVANGLLYVVNSNAVEVRRESDGGLEWAWLPPEGQIGRTMVATNNLLFVSTAGSTYAVDLAARRTVWSHAAGGSLALTQDGILLIAGEDGRLTAIDLK
jgi:outer membrane protein assembly factor BamB